MWYISLGFLLSSYILPLLESWFRDYLWFNSTPLIHGYSTLGTNDLSVQSWSFLLTHLAWASGFMFLISWRGYWQELIDIILYIHFWPVFSQFWPQNCARRVKKAPKGAGRKKKMQFWPQWQFWPKPCRKIKPETGSNRPKLQLTRVCALNVSLSHPEGVWYHPRRGW